MPSQDPIVEKLAESIAEHIVSKIGVGPSASTDKLVIKELKTISSLLKKSKENNNSPVISVSSEEDAPKPIGLLKKVAKLLPIIVESLGKKLAEAKPSFSEKPQELQSSAKPSGSSSTFIEKIQKMIIGELPKSFASKVLSLTENRSKPEITENKRKESFIGQKSLLESSKETFQVEIKNFKELTTILPAVLKEALRDLNQNVKEMAKIMKLLPGLLANLQGGGGEAGGGILETIGDIMQMLPGKGGKAQGRNTGSRNARAQELKAQRAAYKAGTGPKPTLAPKGTLPGKGTEARNLRAQELRAERAGTSPKPPGAIAKVLENARAGEGIVGKTIRGAESVGGRAKEALGKVPGAFAKVLENARAGEGIVGKTIRGAESVGGRAEQLLKSPGAEKILSKVKGAGKILGKIGGPVLGTALAGMEFAGRKAEGQSTTQAVVGTGAGVAGGIGGAISGAAAGAAIGSVVPVLGTAVGGIVGGIIGGFGGGTLASKIADKLTGVNNPVKKWKIRTEKTPDGKKYIETFDKLPKEQQKQIESILATTTDKPGREATVDVMVQDILSKSVNSETGSAFAKEIKNNKNFAEVVEELKSKKDTVSLNYLKSLNEEQLKSNVPTGSSPTAIDNAVDKIQSKARLKNFESNTKEAKAAPVDSKAPAKTTPVDSIPPEPVKAAVSPKAETPKEVPKSPSTIRAQKEPQSNITPASEFPSISKSTTEKTDQKSNKNLEDIASNTENTNKTLANLVIGFNNMAKALEKFGISVANQPPTIVSAGGGNKSQPSPRTTSSQYANAGNGDITNFRIGTVEASRFHPV